MIHLTTLEADVPELNHSRLLSGIERTFGYIEEHGHIGLTQTKAFNRKFVNWAVEHFGWPDY